MKKKASFAIVGIAVLIVVALAAAWCLGAFGPSPLGGSRKALLRYAPKDANAIAYVNSKKFYSHKIGKMMMEQPKFMEAIEKFQAKTFGLGAEFDESMVKAESDAVVFFKFDFKSGKEPQLWTITRYDKKGIPQKVLDTLKAKKDGDWQIAAVDGKSAAVLKEKIALIALSDDMLQLSNDPVCLKKGDMPALAKEIDTDAFYSFALKIDAEFQAGLKKRTEGRIPCDLNLVTVNARGKGDDLAVEMAGTYEKAESAKAVAGVIQIGTRAIRGKIPENIAKKLERIKIEAKGKKVVISFTVTAADVQQAMSDFQEML